ncbi:MAG TPA: chitinase [Paraburkholderia sp.]|nr:chitinase [Paraburkholderia sp.]
MARLLLAVGMGLPIIPTAHAASPYVPYVDMSFPPGPSIDTVGVQQGIQQFTLAYVVAAPTGCAPSWSGTQTIGGGNSSDFLTSVATALKNYRAKGGEIAVSFGGSKGVPLMQACTSTATLQAAYQTVIDTYALKHIDFDISSTTLKDTAALARNFQAIAQLQSAMAAKGTPLRVTLTLPVMPTGLSPDGVNAINAALASKVSFDLVNARAMDYGMPVANMGQAAIEAAQSLYVQLDAAFKAVGQTKTDPELWAMVGVTPMIGANNSQGETFELKDVQSLLNLAFTNTIGMLASWSVNRDTACATNSGNGSDVCSGVAQKPYDFTNLFLQDGDHWGTGVTRDPTYAGAGTGSCNATIPPQYYIADPSYPGWDASRLYDYGDMVTCDLAVYLSVLPNQARVPGHASQWQYVDGPMTWSQDASYWPNAYVLYGDSLYRALTQNSGVVPVDGAVWSKIPNQ